MAAAMAQIRAELGPEALILATRAIAEGVEVTAAVEPAEAPAPALPDPARAALLAWHGVPPALRTALGIGALEPALAAALRFAPLTLGADAPPLLLVGPPGAGKTLAVARLATRLVLAGRTPRVITADGQRAGAVEQLAAFTRLLGLDLVAAGTPATLARALARADPRAAGGGGGPVLIDTPGLDPFDPGQRALLAELIATARGTTALVLPAGLDPAEAEEQAEAHAEAGAVRLIATRLDLARRLGGVLAAAGVLALAEAGVGPGAADGLVPLTPALLAARLRLGPPPRSAPAGSRPAGAPAAPAADSAPFLPPFPAPPRALVGAPSCGPDAPPPSPSRPPTSRPTGMAVPLQAPFPQAARPQAAFPSHPAISAWPTAARPAAPAPRPAAEPAAPCFPPGSRA